jgi:hypothetical protein
LRNGHGVGEEAENGWTAGTKVDFCLYLADGKRFCAEGKSLNRDGESKGKQ